MKYHITTYGCQMNVSDSELMSGILDSMGMIEVETEKEADLVVLNTCMVREKPVNKLFGKLQELGSKKKNRVKKLVIVAGCISQKLQTEIFDKAKSADIIIGTRSITELPQLIERSLNGEKRVTGNFDNDGDELQILENKRTNSYSSYLTIMMGCNNFCSYCIVPYTRGREKCFPPEVLLEKINKNLDTGSREITLLGQNVNSYICDKGKFPWLIKEIDKIDKEFFLRFMTSHPKDMSDELIELYGDSKHLASHVHLPVQSGSNRILKLMNRKYTREHYLGLIEKIRKVNPDIAITTDIITGFPGETEEEYEETKNLLKEVRFDAAYTFFYSERSGTKACDFENKIPVEIRKKRLFDLIELQNEITSEKNQDEVGKIRKVLIYGESKKRSNELQGKASNSKVINFPYDGDENRIGQFAMVKVTESTKFALRGIEIKD